MYYIYILTTKNNQSLYIGVTNDLPRRIQEHKDKLVEGFTKKYNINKLVYYEGFDSVEEALQAEKNMKKWKREWKINIINKVNPKWEDLSEYL